MTIPTTVSVAPADEYPADGHTMTDKLTATLDKAGVRAISTDLWGIFFEDISYSGDGGLNADLVQNGAFEYNRADSIDWSNYSFWRKIVPEGSFAASVSMTMTRLPPKTRITRRWKSNMPLPRWTTPAGTAWCSVPEKPTISPPGCACDRKARCR